MWKWEKWEKTPWCDRRRRLSLDLLLCWRGGGGAPEIRAFLQSSSSERALFGNIFLSDPSPIIVYPCHSLTDWLTNCCLVNFTDVTLACEDANSKLVDVVTVADEDRVGNNLLQIWKLRFGQKANLLLRLWAQGLVKILKLKFRQDLKLELGQFFMLLCRGY